MSKLAALRVARLWMLREGGLQQGNVRGFELLNEKQVGPERETSDQRLPPKYRATFVLSGDWR